jgi:hypothetical protein
MHGPQRYWLVAASSIARGAIHFIKGFEHLFGSRADGGIFGEIYPENCACGIDQEFSGPGNVGASGSGGGMEEIIAPDHLGLWVGKNRKGESHLLTMTSICLRRINADRDNANASRLKIRQPMLETP